MPETRIKGIEIGDYTITASDISLASAAVISPVTASNFVIWDTVNAILKTSTLANVEDYFNTKYSAITHNHAIDDLSNTMIVNKTIGELLKWNGTFWVNNTLAEAGIEPEFTKNTGFNKNFGTTADTVSEGNHSHTFTALGATTAGNNLVTLANPNAISFLRINANNTVSALSAQDMLTAIGGGTSNYASWVLKVNSEGTGVNITSGVGVNFIAGTDVTITRSGTDVTINSTGGGGGSYLPLTGGQLTGDLEIRKSGATFNIKSNLLGYVSSTDILDLQTRVYASSGTSTYDYYILRTDNISTRTYGLLSTSFRGGDVVLSIGSPNFDDTALYAKTDVIGNITHVYTATVAGNTKLVPIASFGGGSGTVTNVGLSMPNIFTVTNSPVTTTGTLTAAFNTQTQQKVLASPQFGTGVPTFRALTADDMPDLSAMYDNYLGWELTCKISGTEQTNTINSIGNTVGTYHHLRITSNDNSMTIVGTSGSNNTLNLDFAATGWTETLVSLTSAGWSGGAQTEPVSGLLATSEVMIFPPMDRTAFLAYGAAQISATSMWAGNIMFECTTTPVTNINNVIVWWK